MMRRRRKKNKLDIRKILPQIRKPDGLNFRRRRHRIDPVVIQRFGIFMAEVTKQKYLDYSGLELLWRKIRQRYDKKLDSVTNRDSSIKVTSDREIAVNISTAEDNKLTLKQDGLYVPGGVVVLQHKLRFGTELQYEFDGSKDVDVPVYGGEYPAHPEDEEYSGDYDI